MRRLLIFALVTGVLATMPARAAAGGFVIDFHDDPAAGIEVYGFTDCDFYCGPQDISVALERGGTTIASAGPARDVRVPVVPAPGDIVRIHKDGVERATVAYDGAPSLDDALPCSAPGGATLGGAFRHGVPAPQPFSPGGPHGGVLVDAYTALSIWRPGSDGFVPAKQITTDGDRWTATFSRPFAAGERIGLWQAYTISTPVGVATVWSWRSAAVCTPPPPVLPMPEPPPCTAAAIGANPGFRTRLKRAVERLRLRALRKGLARVAVLPSCPGGTVAVEVRAGGVVVAKGTTKATGTDVTQPLRRTRRAARLAGKRRAAVKVTIRIADGAGDMVSWSRRLTLH